MNGISRIAWITAISLSLAVHAAVALTIAAPTKGVAGKPIGAPITVSGSLASILGAASPAKPAAKSNDQPTDAKAEQAKPVTTPVAEDLVENATSQKVRPVETAAIAARSTSAVSVASVRPTPADPVTPIQNQRVNPVQSDAAQPIKQVPAKPVKIRRHTPPTKKRRRKAKSVKSASISNSPSGTRRQGRAGRNRGGKGGRSNAVPGAVANYGSKVRARILSNRPSNAGSGRVLIAFGVTSSGRLRFARIARSSGHSNLDQAVLRAVRRSSPFPKPPAGATARQLTFTIPFTFR
jgi:periplasmic protein TonB